jgi:hypothetical protein
MRWAGVRHASELLLWNLHALKRFSSVSHYLDIAELARTSHSAS